ncbi:enoyl-CoA hydratase/isomerase family protein [Paenarthrobacter nitroguajacolicus]|uniref:enoyl-CoA hydratase/isomerase family protein n=1 Tax=Paenarthrobacter nitroguajacolicus TaxID=211146 RepID=UPI003D23969A
MLAVEHDGPLMILRINHGKVNAFDLDLVRAISHQVQDLGPAKGVVITGTDRIFSAGVNLTRLLENDVAYTAAFVTELDALVQSIFELSVPMVAALTGHAIAGACLLAAACDYRVMAQGRIGVTEALVGLPVPPASLEVLRFTAGSRTAGLVLSGRTVEANEALALGLIDEVTTQDSVERRAVEVARQFASTPAQTFALHKQMLRADASRRIREALTDHATLVAQAWTGEEPRQFAGDYMSRLKSHK